MALIGKNIHQAAEILINHDVVAIPTETVYGLAGNPFSARAIDKIYAVKERPKSNPLIVHLSDSNKIYDFVDQLPDSALKLIAQFWPGPLTLLLPTKTDALKNTSSGKSTIAFRVPDHHLTLQLLRLLDFPLAAPSANLYKQISPTSAQHVEHQIGKSIEYILDGGECLRGIESTIIAFEDNIPVIFRKGLITPEDIKVVCGDCLINSSGDTKIKTPGMDMVHYAPLTPLYLVKNTNKLPHSLYSKKTGFLSYNDFNPMFDKKDQFILSKNLNLYEIAQNLYRALHELDSKGYDILIAEYVPNKGIGLAINDRLTRAATDSISSN